MKNVRKSVSAILLVLVLIMSSSAYSQDKNDILDRKIALDFASADFITVLDTLALKERLPIGLERSSKPSVVKLDIHAADMTVRETLNVITEQDPNYQWRLCDGVINFSPVKDRSVILQNFLKTNVSDFSQRAGTSRFKLRDALFNAPEVSDFLKSNYVEGLKEYYAYKQSDYSADSLDLELKNKDVRSILNTIAKNTEFRIWVVELSQDGKKLLVTF